MDDKAPLPQIADLRSIIERFGLTTLKPSLDACEALAPGANGLLDVAVFGQFKSGKSSLLNAVLGQDVLPVGVLPVTAVVTRLAAGSQLAARITRHNGSVENIDSASIADYVSEARNPNNREHVAVVDLLTPALTDLPGLRLVDTPGLGSVFAHNTQSTRDWLPNVAIALVAVSADRPLSDEDRRLIAELRPHAPRIQLILTKVDLLTEAQRQEVRTFMSDQLRDDAAQETPILFFSIREQPQAWVSMLKDTVLRPLSAHAQVERERALSHKLTSLASSCRGYLRLALDIAERAESDRERLAAAALDESVKEPVIRDEMQLAAQRMIGLSRPTIDKAVMAHRHRLEDALSQALRQDAVHWNGNLAQQTARYQAWMLEHLFSALEPVSSEVVPIAYDLLGQAEARFRRIAEAFSDRLSRNVSEATGIQLSPVAWEATKPALVAPPVRVSPAFMTNWELLAWLIPIFVVGGLFRRHIASRVPWEVEKNLTRLTSDWTETTAGAISDLKDQAIQWVLDELKMVSRLLAQRPEPIEEIRAAISKVN